MIKVTTYRETYNKPVRHIAVPKELNGSAFEVSFTPITITKRLKKEEKKLNFGEKLASYFADIPPPSCPEEEFILPSRQDFNKNREVSFD